MKLIKNTPKIWIKKFPWKKKSSNKYSRGRVLILGGQKNMIGATILAAEACLRVGVGSVKIICSNKTLQIYSIKFPSVLKAEINNSENQYSIYFGPNDYKQLKSYNSGYEEIIPLGWWIIGWVNKYIVINIFDILW